MNYLLKKAINGDKSAENKFIELLFVRFSYLAKQRVGEGSYEDIAQEACITVLEKYSSLNGSVEFEAWANKVLRNKIGNYYQKKNTEANYIVNDVNTSEYTHAKNVNPKLRVKVSDCLSKLHKLNPRYHKILRLVSEGYDTEEICGKLKVKPNNLYVILNRSRKLLKECLRNDEK